MDERQKLIQRLYEQDKRCEKLKAVCFWLVVLLYFVIDFAILYFIFLYNKQCDISAYLLIALISAGAALVSYFINFTMFLEIFRKIDEENKYLNAAKKQLVEYDREHNA